jgi:hypothetical protein
MFQRACKSFRAIDICRSSGVGGRERKRKERGIGNITLSLKNFSTRLKIEKKSVF